MYRKKELENILEDLRGKLINIEAASKGINALANYAHEIAKELNNSKGPAGQDLESWHSELSASYSCKKALLSSCQLIQDDIRNIKEDIKQITEIVLKNDDRIIDKQQSVGEVQPFGHRDPSLLLFFRRDDFDSNLLYYVKGKDEVELYQRPSKWGGAYDLLFDFDPMFTNSYTIEENTNKTDLNLL